ncbi:MAG: HlyD family secretion protein [Xanthomonadaceae bacterium]|nr:HlyD family secretion protein [Xanthomonadaceae bacterium]
MADLFRKEVVAQRASALFDGVVIRGGARSTLLSVTALLLALGVIAIACAGSYARKERLHGALVPDAGLVAVVAPTSGVISHMAVADGDTVLRGAPLFTIVAPADSGSGIDARAAQLDLLLAERATLVAQADAEARLRDAERAELERRMALANDQAVSLATQEQIAARRTDLLVAELERLESLAARGHVAANLLDLKLADLLDARAALLSTRRERTRYGHEAAESAEQLTMLPARADVRIAELGARLLTLDRAIATADAEWSRTIRAPTDGQVAALRLHIGAAVAAGSAALALVPDGSPLHAELMLPARAAGFVTPGQQVQVRYDAYPYQRFGLQPAVVRAVARVALNPDEQRGAVRLPEPAYRVVVALDRQVVPMRDGELPLRPGLTLQADVIRDRRRIIEWLLDPVLAAAAR